MRRVIIRRANSSIQISRKRLVVLSSGQIGEVCLVGRESGVKERC